MKKGSSILFQNMCQIDIRNIPGASYTLRALEPNVFCTSSIQKKGKLRDRQKTNPFPTSFLYPRRRTRYCFNSYLGLNFNHSTRDCSVTMYHVFFPLIAKLSVKFSDETSPTKLKLKEG